ncbi:MULTISPECIES: cytochrome b/b6 domain-containing protein [Methylobacteriaceae]|uniref:Cytochrome b/b6 domain-containing protein n=3 Tax=Methylobacteriaceae TaxID=119045 RepID=A0ABU9ZKY2_9HYPH|nr:MULTISPECIES: cytochrome b/b6 domain-containing protein [Methylobacteriaceae]MBY0143878.1 cytochrome b/b6 domain-containing protein [Methylorubrum populi]MCX7332301.1 cytochrome b/b6 domain-containing protein [Hyphomicrobiales bacterium]MBI1691035.1 cytochrome b [Methylorubrum sp. DB1722]MBK3402274.1 cytochrome b/b6 domain-containing protein [Methylorubrum rhodesianum]MBY0253344.1 cytochrome b/b6 domain-containing protein [Methylobacterium organophilum]
MGRAPYETGYDTSSRETSYDGTTIALHLLTGGLVLVLWLIGTLLEDLVPKGTLRSGIWSAHFVLGFAFTGVIVMLLIWRQTKGRQLPVDDPGPLHVLAKATHLALYLLLLVIAGLGIANAFVRGVTLIGPLALPALGDPEWRRPLTHWHGLAANVLMAVAAFHAAAALGHHYLWHDAVLRRILPGRASSAPYERS